MQYLEEYLINGEKDDLSLRRFCPTDFASSLKTPVQCPFLGCGFNTSSGEEMTAHQSLFRHPGWNRYCFVPTGSAKSWCCSAESCDAAFLKWDQLYKHLQSHSKPFGCPACPFRTDRPRRLKEHQEKTGHPASLTTSGHWTRVQASDVLRVATIKEE